MLLQGPHMFSIPCKTHCDEPVAYFCLQCECECICAECVIHGDHRNHDVQKIRRAYPLIKSKVEDFIFSVNGRIEELTLAEQRIESHRRELQATVSSAKQQMAKSFEEVRQRLASKEKELMANVDIFLRDGESEIDNRTKTNKQKMAELQGSAEKIRRHLSAGDDLSAQVMLLNFYAEARGLLNQSLLESANANQAEQFPSLMQRKVALDVDSVNAHIEALQGLHVTIAGLNPPNWSGN
eukprot:Filipodium_phascolosomae@DN251_c0_g1_i2.p1